MKKYISIIIAIIIVILIVVTYNLVYKKGKEDQLTDKYNNTSKEENITTQEINSTNETSENDILNTNSEEISTKENDIEMIAQVSPSGFMGSSSYRVVLYSDKEVYVIKYDGNGYEEQNIISKELIAKNVQSINTTDDEEHYGEVIIKGGEKISTNFGWISFQ